MVMRRRKKKSANDKRCYLIKPINNNQKNQNGKTVNGKNRRRRRREKIEKIQSSQCAVKIIKHRMQLATIINKAIRMLGRA